MVNKVILVGRLGKDPESRYTGSGTPVANFSIATDEKWKDRNGKKQHRTEWHRCVAWSKLAEIIQQYCTKGMLVFIEGALQTRSWEKEGVKHYSTEIVVRELKMLGGGERGGNKPENPPTEAYQGERNDTGPTGTEISDEDIPF